MLMTTFALGRINNQSLWAPHQGDEEEDLFPQRVGTMSIEAALMDMCQCVLYNTDKREKRMKRIQLLIQLYTSWGYQFDEELSDYVEYALAQEIVESTEKQPIEMLTALQDELNTDVESNNGIIYFDASVWSPPVSKNFHGSCTKFINQNGDVYDIMMKVAVIAFSCLLQADEMYTHQQCTIQLLAGAQLIFKGGAAIGKFLFQQHPIWNTLSDAHKDEIMSSFIQGGDNDTSIYFANMKGVVKEHGNEKVSESIAEIASRLDKLLFAICEEFKISEMLSEHSARMIRSPISFADCDFDVSIRKTKGFRLTQVESYDDDEFVIAEKAMCLTPHDDRNESQVFTTQSKVEFAIKPSKIAKFELVRAKLAFTAKHADTEVSTYSELLDISIGYPESSSLFPKRWAAIHM